MCPTQCPTYQRRFAHSSPVNSDFCGIPLRPILGTVARLIIIWRRFVSTAAGVFRRPKINKEELENWLRNQGAKEAHTADALFDFACGRLRSLRVELPAEGELECVVNAALNGFFQDIHRRISDALAPEVRAGIDALLVVPESAVVSGFEGLKADPGKAGVNNLQAEIEKLTRTRAIGVGTEPFANLPWKVLQILKRRASKETASEMRDHSNVIRYALMASYLYVRAMEVTDDITRMAIDLIHRLAHVRKSRSIGSFSPI